MFPNQNVYNSPFYINHPQLSVIHHQKQIYRQIIRDSYNNFPKTNPLFTVYSTIYKPVIEIKPF